MQRIKLFYISFIFLMGIINFVWAQPIDRTVATVKLYENEVISQSQFKRIAEAMVKQTGRQLTLDEKKKLLEQLISEKLLIQAANKEKIVVTESEINSLKDQTKAMYEAQVGKPMSEEEFRSYILKTGYTWEDYLKELRKGLMAQKYLRLKKSNQLQAISSPTDKEVQDYYTANQHLFVSREMVRIRQIYIDPKRVSTVSEQEQVKKKAQNIIRELKAGGSFDNYWEVYDDSGRVKIGGLVNSIFRRGDQTFIDSLGQDFIDKVFSLPLNTISDLLTSKAGYHIVSVIEKIPFKVLGLDDLIPPANALTVRNYIKQLLTKLKEQEALQKALSELIAELKKIAEIKIFNENLVW